MTLSLLPLLRLRLWLRALHPVGRSECRSGARECSGWKRAPAPPPVQCGFAGGRRSEKWASRRRLKNETNHGNSSLLRLPAPARVIFVMYLQHHHQHNHLGRRRGRLASRPASGTARRRPQAGAAAVAFAKCNVLMLMNTLHLLIFSQRASISYEPTERPAIALLAGRARAEHDSRPDDDLARVRRRQGLARTDLSRRRRRPAPARPEMEEFHFIC